MNQQFEQFFEYISGFQSISKELKQELEKYFSILSLPKKSILIREGGKHQYAYFMVKGGVRSYFLKDGVEVNSYFAFENELIASLPIQQNMVSRETIELLEDSEIIAIDLNKLKPLMYSSLEVSNFLNIMLEDYVIYLENRLTHIQMLTAKEKYDNLLKSDPKIFQRVSLTHIASYLGISRETLSRMRAK